MPSDSEYERGFADGRISGLATQMIGLHEVGPAHEEITRRISVMLQAVTDLFTLLAKDGKGEWCFRSLSKDAAKFQQIITTLNRVTLGAAAPSPVAAEDNRLEEIRANLADGYLEVYRSDSQAAFGRTLSDLRYLLSLIDTNYNAGLEAAAKVAETKFAPTEYGRWDAGYVNAGIAIATAIRALKK
jgi:hypothetical protein